jgi:hypothetical protein
MTTNRQETLPRKELTLPPRDHDREARRIAPKVVDCSREEAHQRWLELLEMAGKSKPI